MKEAVATVYLADPAELAQVLVFYEQHIPDLKKFLNSLGSEDFNTERLSQWFERYPLPSLGVRVALTTLVEDPLFAALKQAEKLEYCLSVVDKQYHRDLVEQYVPFAHLLRHCTLDAEVRQQNRLKAISLIAKGCWVNDKKLRPMLLPPGNEEIYLAKVAEQFAELGMINAAMFEFILENLVRFNKAVREYYDKMLTKIDIWGGHENVTIHVDYDVKNSCCAIHFVRTHRNFYRIRQGMVDYDGDHSADNLLPIVAQSATSFLISGALKSEFTIKLLGGKFEVYNEKHRGIICRDLSRQYVKKILSCEPLDKNAELIVENLCRGFSEITDFKSVVNRLKACKDSLVIFLAAKRSDLILKEIFRDSELLNCLCSSSRHRDYLEFLKCWYSRDRHIVDIISLLLDRIKLLADADLSRVECCEMVASYFEALSSYKLQARLPGVVLRQRIIYLENVADTLKFTVIDASGEIIAQNIPRKILLDFVPDFDGRINLQQLTPLLPHILEILSSGGFVRKNNLIFMMAAIHSLVGKNQPQVEKLLAHPTVRAQLGGEGLLRLALVFGDVASWLFDNENIMELSLTRDALCDLLKKYPLLWAKIHSSLEVSIRGLPTKLLSSEKLGLLFLENGHKDPSPYAVSALCRDQVLFKRLCQLQNSRPNELLCFFAKVGYKLKKNWEEDYKTCERHLLSCCDKTTIENYYRSLFDRFDSQAFARKFKSIVLKGDCQNGNEQSQRYAKKVLIDILIERIEKNCDYSEVCDSQVKLGLLVQLLAEEPRLAGLLKFDSIQKVLKDSNDRNFVRVFVDIIVDHYSDACLGEVTLQIAALGLLSAEELRDFLKISKNRLFLLNLIVKEPLAVEILISAAIEVGSDDIPLILNSAFPQLLLLLLMGIVKAEQPLRDKMASLTRILAIYKDSPDQSLSADYIQQNQRLQKVLTYLLGMKEVMLCSKPTLQRLLDAEEFSVIDWDCLIKLFPDCSQRFAAVDLLQPYQVIVKQQRSLDLPPELMSLQSPINSSGLDLEALSIFMEQSLVTDDTETLVLYLNHCLFVAFASNDVALGLISTPKLLNLVLNHADLGLIAKFMCLFARSGVSLQQWTPFFERIATQFELSKIYAPLLHFYCPGSGKALVHSLAAATPARVSSHLIKRFLRLGEFDPRDFVVLLLSDYSDEPGQRPYRTWLLQNPQRLTQVVAVASPDELAEILHSEIRLRTGLDNGLVLEIEDFLRKEPLITAILRLSGGSRLLQLLQADREFFTPIWRLSRLTLLHSNNVLLWSEVINRATTPHLVELTTQADLSCWQLQCCFKALSGLIRFGVSGDEITLTPEELLSLLRVAQHRDPEKTWQAEWGDLLKRPELVFGHLLQKTTVDTFVIKAMPILQGYFPECAHLIDRYLEQDDIRNPFNYEAFAELALDSLIDFLVSARGLEMASLRPPNKLPSIFKKLICSLFLEGNTSQLQRLAVSNYVRIFIDQMVRYNTLPAKWQAMVVPRAILALNCLYKQDPAVVEQEFADNSQLVSWIRAARNTCCLLIGLPLFQASEQVRKSYDARNRLFSPVGGENLPLRERSQSTHSLLDSSFNRSASQSQVQEFARQPTVGAGQKNVTAEDSERSVVSSLGAGSSLK